MLSIDAINTILPTWLVVVVFPFKRCVGEDFHSITSHFIFVSMPTKVVDQFANSLQQYFDHARVDRTEFIFPTWLVVVVDSSNSKK